MRPFAVKFYSSNAWKLCRDNVKQRDHGLCQDCLKKGLITPADAVHHIIELTPENINNPEISLNEKNLVSLCRDCHAARHGKTQRYKIDEFGRVTITG